MKEIYSDVLNFDDTVIGTDDDDSIFSGGIRSTISGGAGNDTIDAGGYLSTIDGGAGNDIINVGRSYIAAHGDNGNDYIEVNTFLLDENIGNVTLTGGAGNDLFGFAVPSRNIRAVTITDFSVSDGDGLSFVRNDIADFYLTYGNNSDGDLVFRDSYDRIEFTMKGISDFNTVANTRVILSEPEGTPYWSTLRETVRQTMYISSEYEGDVWLDASYMNIDARADTVAGRILAGNDQNNAIFAGSGGASLWGGSGGTDYLYGGAGADTFVAGAGEGNVVIADCSNDDIVILKDIGLENVSGLGLAVDSVGNAIALEVMTNDGTTVEIKKSDAASTTTLQINDGSRFRYNYSERDWYAVENDVWTPLSIINGDLSVYVDGDGRNVLKVQSSYGGNVSLDGSEYFSSIEVIDAVDDTVSGRIFVGNALDNEIRACSGGASIDGGKGNDTLIGGAGADTFVAGAGDGNVVIVDCADDDIVILKDIDLDDVSGLGLAVDADGNTIGLEVMTSDGTIVEIKKSDAASITTVQLNDGAQWHYGYAAQQWFQWLLPDGLIRDENNITVTSDYEGDLWLGGRDFNGAAIVGWSDASIEGVDARNDTTVGRMLAGNALDNTIRAGSGGASMWGGVGGTDYIYGGAGEDTLCISTIKSADSTTFHYFGAEDVVYFVDVDSESYNALYTIQPYDNLHYIAVYDTDSVKSVFVWSDMSANTADFRFADGYQLRYNYSESNWYVRENDAWRPYNQALESDGLIYDASTVTVTSSYAGDVVLGGVDWTGATVDGFTDASIEDIDAPFCFGVDIRHYRTP